MRILGIDPGAYGALALLDAGSTGPFNRSLLTLWDMPVIVGKVGGRNKSQISESLLAGLIRDARPDVVWLEQVHAMPRQGVTSSFNFGVAYGMARGVCAALGVPVQLIAPPVWKRHFRLGSGKHDSRLLACRLFPGSAAQFARVRDDGRAEAALLALYGSQQGSTQFSVDMAKIVAQT